ncbi:hypothetical protein ACFX2I_037045 [Malus domestica]
MGFRQRTIVEPSNKMGLLHCEPGFKHDQFTYTTMLDIFGEAGRVSSMTHVFKQMQEKGIKIDDITYTSLMHWLSNAGDVDGAVHIWEEMRAQGCWSSRFRIRRKP